MNVKPGGSKQPQQPGELPAGTRAGADAPEQTLLETIDSIDIEGLEEGTLGGGGGQNERTWLSLPSVNEAAERPPQKGPPRRAPPPVAPVRLPGLNVGPRPAAKPAAPEMRPPAAPGPAKERTQPLAGRSVVPTQLMEQEPDSDPKRTQLMSARSLVQTSPPRSSSPPMGPVGALGASPPLGLPLPRTIQSQALTAVQEDQPRPTQPMNPKSPGTPGSSGLGGQQDSALEILTDETLLPLPGEMLMRRLNAQRDGDQSRIRPVQLAPEGPTNMSLEAVPAVHRLPPSAPERTETKPLSPGGRDEQGTGSRVIRLAHRVQERMHSLRKKESRGSAAGVPRGLGMRHTIWLVVVLMVIAGAGVLGGWLIRQRHLDEMVREAAAGRRAAEAGGNLADLLLAADQYQLLLAALPAAADQQALSARAHLLTQAVYEHGGLIQQKAGEGDSLREEATRAAGLVMNEGDPDAQAAQAYLALLGGDFSGAQRRARALGETDAALGDYLYGLGALAAGEIKEAAGALKRSLRGGQRNPEGHRQLAQALLALGQEAEAIDELNEALRLNPGHQGSFLDRTWLRARRDPAEDERARKTIGRLIEAALSSAGGADQAGAGGSQGAVTDREARSAAVTDREARGAAVTGREAPQAPRSMGRSELLRAYLALADLALRATPADLTAARTQLGLAQAVYDPGDAVLGEELAGELLRAQKSQAARQVAQQVLGRAPGRRAVRLVLVEAQLRCHQAEDARQALVPLVDVNRVPPQADPEVRLLAARVLLGLDQTLQAQAVLRPLLQGGGPAQVEAELLQCRSALLLGDQSEAQGLLQRIEQKLAVMTLQQRGELHLLRARALLAQRPARRQQAQAALEQAVAEAPEQSEAHLLLGQALRAQGDLKGAQAQLVLALQGDEAEQRARRELAKLALEMGDAKLAREHYDQLLGSEADGEVILGAVQAHRLSGDPQGALRVLADLRGAQREPGLENKLLSEKARALIDLGRTDEAQQVLQRLGGR